MVLGGQLAGQLAQLLRSQNPTIAARSLSLVITAASKTPQAAEIIRRQGANLYSLVVAARFRNLQARRLKLHDLFLLALFPLQPFLASCGINPETLLLIPRLASALCRIALKT